ncbi:MAG: hypothetical protein K9N34_09150 [Candidatus Marinimicrobia bacterium]|nr:hypothetical protein [Candidatus Neomarinimicrobiota bacterium]MCF7840261.1 hypothetical protein [Candidatus Neomarinimicrobiota bacterium]MCF7902618.1 hypothetical protein [Candidatus Neomarinimicrobiota bacterium]
MSEILTREALILALHQRLEARIPTSVIRKGDGENMVLGYGLIPTIPRKWYYKKMYHFNVYPWQIRFQLFLRTQLVLAFQQADYLGISKPEHRHGLWSQEEEILRIFGLENRVHCDMNFHMDFIKYPSQYRLVTSEAEKLVTGRRVGLITHRSLDDFFAHFDSKVVFQTKIPKRRSRVEVMTQQRFQNILAQIDAHTDDVDVWFVGAGIYAKPFCNHIKATGGIGIDLGSTLDSWADDYQSRGHLRKFYREHTPR